MDWGTLESATAELEAPFALVDLDAFWNNASDLVTRAGGKPVRLASKSVRCRALQERVLASSGFRGTLAFTLPEAIWLTDHGFSDIVVAYPTADRAALASLGGRPITLMVDSVEQLGLIAAARGQGPDVRLCMDVDAGWWVLGGRVKIGAKRSPIHTAAQAAALAREISRRDGFELVGIIAYESQIAGVGDRPPGKPLRGMLLRSMQSRSAAELRERRAEIVAAVRAVADLEFVNGGGTGSVERTTSEDAITEVAAGSGLYGPRLFDAYGSFRPRPAALFALPVVRRPSASIATVLGGGYLASGPADSARLPQPFLPPGLKLDGQEGAGEVQTPLSGDAARSLRVGDRVYFRHAKAGEMCERFDRLYLLEGGRVVESVPTYRGEGEDVPVTWSNWAGEERCSPAQYLEPASEDELSEAIVRAGERSLTVRVAGAGHSFTPAVLTDGLLISLRRMNLVMEVDVARGLARVQAGITLHDLSEELDRHGLALENLGDIDVQSVAGATATGTHGTGAGLKNLSASIHSVGLTLADGSLIEVNEETDADAWRAARVSIGALGVVTTMTIRTVPAFTLRAVDEPKPLDEVLDRLDELADTNDHFEFYTFPHSKLANTRTNNRVDDPPRAPVALEGVVRRLHV